MRFIDSANSLIRTAYANMVDTPASVFKAFIAVVLTQFAVLSFISITFPSQVQALDVGTTVLASSHYWWGLLSLFGGATLFFEHYFRHWAAGIVCGYLAAIASFIYSSYDLMLRKPPIYVGGVLTVTAALFMGGIAYGRFKKLWKHF